MYRKEMSSFWDSEVNVPVKHLDVSVIRHGCPSWIYLWVTSTWIVDTSIVINQFSKGSYVG